MSVILLAISIAFTLIGHGQEHWKTTTKN